MTLRDIRMKNSIAAFISVQQAHLLSYRKFCTSVEYYVYVFFNRFFPYHSAIYGKLAIFIT